MICGTDAEVFAVRSILVVKSPSCLCLLLSEPALIDRFGEPPGDTARLTRLRVFIRKNEDIFSLLDPEFRIFWAFESETFLLILGACCW